MTVTRRATLILALALAAGATAALSPEPLAAQDAAQSPAMEGLQTSRTGPLEDPALEARAIRLADQLRCPVCQGLSIHDSPSPLAQDMKDLIRSQVAGGATDDEVRQYFISKYGEWVLLEPKPSGFNLLVYILPALGLLAGAAFIFFAVRRWTAPEDDPVVAENP
jgi:cytochrome c-type biogenesis protein CcmH